MEVFISATQLEIEIRVLDMNMVWRNANNIGI